MKLFGKVCISSLAGFLLHYNGYSLVEKRWYEFEKRVSLWSEESPERLPEAFLEQMYRSVGYSLMGEMEKGLSLNGSLESALFISLMKEIGLPRSLKSYMHYRGKLHQSGVLWSAEMLAETPLPMEQVKITKSMLFEGARLSGEMARGTYRRFEHNYLLCFFQGYAQARTFGA